MNIELFKSISAVVGCILTCISLVTLLCKPVRNKFIGWIRKNTNISEAEKSINELRNNLTKLSEAVQQHLANSEKFQNEIREEFKTVNQEILRLADNDVLVLRDCILEKYFECKNRGYVEEHERESIAAMHERYIEKGGNSYEHFAYDEFMSLPRRLNNV